MFIAVAFKFMDMISTLIINALLYFAKTHGFCRVLAKYFLRDILNNAVLFVGITWFLTNEEACGIMNA